MAATVKITNTLTTVIGAGEGRPTFISPSGVTVPCTPIQEYVSDMITVVDGTLYIPAYNKVQMLSVPIGSYVTFEVEDAKEINYWENIHVEGAKVEVTDGITTFVPVVTYTVVTFTGEGTNLKPTYAKDTFYTKSGEDYTVVSADVTPENWGTANTFYTKSKTKTPTNNVD